MALFSDKKQMAPPEGAPGVAPPIEEKKGLFTHNKPATPAGPDMGEILNNVKDVSRRLRVAEERYTNLRNKMQVMDHNMITHHKKLYHELHSMADDIREVKKEIQEIKNTALLLIKEMKGFARKEELNVLKRYVEMWEPIRFVTRDEVSKIVEEKLREQ